MPKTQSSSLRIGQGSDIHRLVAGRPCIIGGVRIESPVGPDGHSDGDVLLHAIMDALLGAIGEPDIGHRFPPSDNKFKDADSAKLLTSVYHDVRLAGWELVNLDSSIITERPKIAPHRVAIQQRIAELLAVNADQIGIKATTAEHLGALGRGEGIFAQACVLLQRLPE